MTQDVSHRITIAIERDDTNQGGTLVCFGSCHGGYAIDIIDNRLVYTYNYAGFEISRIVSTREIPPGTTNVAFEFEKTGTLKGRGRLVVDGHADSEQLFERTLLRLSLSQLTFGRSNPEPVDPERQTSPDFAGRIMRIDYAIGEDRDVVPVSLDVD